MALVLALGVFLGIVTDQAHAHSVPELPNVVADPPGTGILEVSSTEGGLKSEGELELLLRFNGYIHNAGPGALEFRGSRTTPAEPMHAFQRIYYADGSFKEEPSAAEFIYVTAAGHNHWHLQNVAKYSLWNSARTAEVAPSQKVGFCLTDDEHVEPNVGPTVAVYKDAANGCEDNHPEATSLFEGVSAGWRDLYSSTVAFQWVNASNVPPGEYWLREDVNPTGVIKEGEGANAPAYATKSTIIPGFDALAQATNTRSGEPKTLTLTSQAWNDSSTPTYKVESQPQHGTLSAVNEDQVTYTPTPGYAGPDSFSFSAADPSSPFPSSPAVATVSIITLPNPPSVLTGVASAVAQTSATLEATVNPEGGAVSDCHFDYGSTSSYGSSAPCVSLPGSGTSPVAVSASVAGLSANTTYYFRVVATNSGGPSYGSEQTFNTLPNPPSVLTGAASAVARTSATLEATVNPEGGAVSDCHFDYGSTSSYGSSAPCVSRPGSGTSPVAVSASVAGLSANTTYYFRVVATNSGGTSYGSEQNVNTLPNPPSVLTGVASAVAQTAATLEATVNPEGGAVSDCHFDYGTTSSYGSSGSCASLPGSGSSPVAVSARVTGLAANTMYYFRVVARNAVGTSYGTGQTFTSLPIPPTQIAALIARQLGPSGKAARIATLLKRSAFAVVFKALEAGTAVIGWYYLPPGAKLAKKAKPKPVLVAFGKLTFSAAGTATVKLKLTAAGKGLLKHAKRLKLTAKGTFTPTGETPITAFKTFVLKR
jgi:phosphodiesterase/alkaline phosphatase D-like protein